MSILQFRNVEGSPEDPVETWPFEGVLAALERGTLPDWHRLAAAVEADPWGRVARYVESALELSNRYGIAPLMKEVIGRARQSALEAERTEVSREIAHLVRASGLTRQEFASRIGTSRSRLSSYVSGSVTPSAALVVRMRKVVRSAGSGSGQVPDRSTSVFDAVRAPAPSARPKAR